MRKDQLKDTALQIVDPCSPENKYRIPFPTIQSYFIYVGYYYIYFFHILKSVSFIIIYRFSSYISSVFARPLRSFRCSSPFSLAFTLWLIINLWFFFSYIILWIIILWGSLVLASNSEIALYIWIGNILNLIIYAKFF